ncbi:protein O-GlcNAcase [Micromonospora sp. B11E3]|uniref:protein O-GlcNAcase n=1 Tax=Micromonospora sp. B11E3 TaxID=3153562 RepID=UPI00325E74E2
MSAPPPHSSPVGDADPGLSMRGTVEGFYGPPWSHPERLAHLEFSARIGLNTYVYAAKDDPHHRARWQDPYPSRELARLARLADTARSLGVRFVYAISPGLTMRYADDADHRALVAKAAQLHDAGVDSFALLFDDVPSELSRPEELERWPGAGAAGAAHGETATRFVEDFLAPRGIRDPLLVCPTDYAGTAVTAYRRHFARTAPADALVAWTGPGIVVRTISRDDIDRAAASYRRRLVLWDNFPVNDFEPSRLFLGPLTGRTGDLAGSALVGVLANPMVQAAPSRLALVSVADWARDPRGYDPEASARRALPRVAGAGAVDLAPLVRVCSSWPPSAAQDAQLARAVDDTLAGVPGAPAVLAGRLEELARGCRAAVEPRTLVSALRPWLTAGAAVAEAGLAAVRLLEAATTAPAAAAAPGGTTAAARAAAPSGTTVRAGERIRALRAAAGLALAEAEGHYANVLRSVVPPFVREALDRTAPPEPENADGGPCALLVTGRRRTAGDEGIAALLERRGYRVCRREAPGPGDIGQASLVVVTRGAEARGPANLTAAEVGPDARVVARAGDEDRAALFHYPAGARLADRTPAPAPRTGLFLAADGVAPWLLAPAGLALVAAALDQAAVGVPRQAGPPAMGRSMSPT